MEQNQTPGTGQTSQQPFFGIEKLYLKDLSVEVPGAPGIFLEQSAPEVDIQLATQGTALGEGAYDVLLTITVTARLGEKPVFLVEAGQAGIFRLVNIPEKEIEPLLAVACPNILQSYAREVISSAVTRAGFPPVVLQPVNFEAIYLSRLEERAASAGAAGATIQ
ncbi:MAG: protein-export chaperone SecB [Zoogloeaceae bacterium]|jgi:preprotein translocase subunit SecB|nr:protein-export chaperone SecB [Zoogloeaceae bacterium]